MAEKIVKNYSSLDLRKKILFGFSFIILIMLSISFWGLFNFNRINSSFNKTIEQNYASILASDNMGKAIDYQLYALLQIISRDEAYGHQMFEDAGRDFNFWYERARKTAFTVEENRLLDSLGIEYRRFNEMYYDGIKYDSLKQRTGFSARRYPAIVDGGNAVKEICYQVFDINHSIMSETIKSVDQMTKTASVFLLLILILAIIFCFTFSSKFSNYLVKPLNEFINSARHISDGNFSDRIEIPGNDEIGVLALEFNKMSEKLHRYEIMNISKLIYEKKKSEIIIENINEPVVLTDKSLNILMQNKSFQEEFVKENKHQNNNLLEIFHNNDSFSSLKLAEADNENDKIFQVTLNGILYYYKIIVSPIKLPESENSGLLIVFNDITRFKEIDRMKSEFIGKVSHELKTPLTSVGMALGILEDGILGNINERQMNLINSMKEDYNRLNSLILKILDFTKVESDSFKLNKEPSDINELIMNVKKKFEIQSRIKKISLVVESNPEKLIVEADIEYLTRAIENIVGNALKFTPEGGTVILRSFKKNNSIYVRTSDSGIGISEDNYNRIFEKFVQIGNETPGSIGLGLPIAKEIVEMHGGMIHVKSTVGKGSEFEIMLKEYDNV